MPYTAEVSRSNPTCFLFLVDQSRSMSDEISAGDLTQQKARGVADTVNRWMQELSLKCAKSEGVGDYYHVGVIGYGKNVGPAFVGEIAGRDLVPISEIAQNPGRVEERVKKVPDGHGGLTEQPLKVPIWFDPVADGGTPMCRAVTEAHRILQDWLGGHADCYPPVVIHITDGEATDGDPQQRVNALTSLSSSDGNVQLFNIHLSANPNATPVIFPDSPDNLPDEYSRMLFETASPLTPTMRAIAKEQGIPTSEGSRAFVLNADMVLLVQAVDIGTRPSNMDRGATFADPVPARDESPAAAAEPERTPEPPPSPAREPEPEPEPSPVSEPEIDDAIVLDSEEPAPEAAPDAQPAVEDATPPPSGSAGQRKTVRLTDQNTGKLIEAVIQTDDDGKIVNVEPVQPLDPDKDYGVGPGPA